MCVNPKFSIRRKLLVMPGEYRSNLYKLSIHINKSSATIDGWGKIEIGCEKSIPVDIMYKMATFFNCTINDLING